MTEPSPAPAPEYLTAEQIAAELDVHVQTVQKYFRDGVLPGRKIGKHWRTTRDAFNTWLTAAPVPGPVPTDHPAASVPVGDTPPPLERK